VRKELFWDTDRESICPEVEIERAINFGGFAFIEEVQKKHGMDAFRKVLTTKRGLSKKAVNYWCLQLGIDPQNTGAFKNKFSLWNPFR
jgi:hypothetical protein